MNPVYEQPIRVAQIMGKLLAGGLESVIYNYYRHINHGKIQFDFYFDADSDFPFPSELLTMGARCFEIPPYQKLPQYLSALRKHFRENSYPIVHANLNTISVFPLFAAWMEKVPVRIAHSHSTASRKEGKRVILKYLLRPFAGGFPTDYLACSEHAGRWLFGNKRFDTGEVLVLNNAIDLERFQYREEVRNAVRKELGLENCFVVGHVGRFMTQKNHAFLIDIFTEVVKREENARLLLVGDGENRQRIEEKLHRMGLYEKTIFTGKVTDTEKYYQAMDVFCFPSLFEGLGMVTIEAQAAGVPVAASEQVPKEAAVSELFTYTLLSDSPEVWAEKLLAIRTKHGMDCIAELRANGFDIRTEAAMLERFYLERAAAYSIRSRVPHQWSGQSP